MWEEDIHFGRCRSEFSRQKIPLSRKAHGVCTHTDLALSCDPPVYYQSVPLANCLTMWSLRSSSPNKGNDVGLAALLCDVYFCNYRVTEFLLLPPSYSEARSILYASYLTLLGLNRVLINKYKYVQSSIKAKRREGLTAWKKTGLWEWFGEMAFELVQNKTKVQIYTSIYSPL